VRGVPDENLLKREIASEESGAHHGVKEEYERRSRVGSI
jgi:hypothetical protein